MMKKICWTLSFMLIASLSFAQSDKLRFVLRTAEGVSYLYVKISTDTSGTIGAEEIYLQDFKETSPTKLIIVERIPIKDNSPKIKVKHPRTGKEIIFIDLFGMSADAEDGKGDYINWMPEIEFTLGNETLCCNSGPFFEPFYYSAKAGTLPTKIEMVGGQVNDDAGNLIFQLKFPDVGVCTVKITFGEEGKPTIAAVTNAQKKVKIFKEKKNTF